MTEKLFYEDSHMITFSAVVKACEKVGDYYEAVLDRTAFFPEGGGQPADEGVFCIVKGSKEDLSSLEIVKELPVADVQKEDGVILHYVKEPLAAGTKVLAKLDFALRYERMQNHSGEHLFCGLIHKLYGYENVGFHMSKDCVTVDVNGSLSAEDFAKLERLANEGVDANREIKAVYPEHPDELEYRSKLELTEDIRVVLIEDYDACACIGAHVGNTCEIGVFKIISHSFENGIWRVRWKVIVPQEG